MSDSILNCCLIFHNVKTHSLTQVLNDTLDEMDLIDIFRTFHPNVEEYTSSQVHMEQSPGQTTSCVTNQILKN